MVIKNKKVIIFLLFSFALLLRVLFIIFYDHGNMLKNHQYANDEYSYNTIAKNFSAGKGLISGDSIYARRGPIYPLFLAVIYFIFGYSFPAVRFIQALVGAISCIIVFLLASRIFKNNIVGLIAGVIFAIDYSLIQIPGYLVTETLYTFIILASVYCILDYVNTKKTKSLILCGFLVGLGALCRDTGIILLPIFIIWLLIILDKSRGIKLKKAIILVLCTVIVISPWLWRNHRLYKRWVGITTIFGHNLYITNHEGAKINTGGYGPDTIYPEDLNYPVYTPEADDFLRKRALNFIFRNPGKALLLTKDKFVEMWRPYYLNARPISKIITTLFYIPIIILGLMGFIINSRIWRITILFVMIIGFNAMLHAFIISCIRYRYPLMPFFIIYAAFTVYNIFLKSKDSKKNLNKLNY